MAKVLDFDRFIREKNKETLDIVVYGETYTVPLEIPAIVPVMMARAEETLDRMQSTKMVYRAADALFGKDAVDKLCSKGISAADLAELVQEVFKEVNGGVDLEDDAQELTDEDSRVSANKSDNGKK